MKLSWRALDVRLRRTFTISHQSLDVRRNVLVELESGGVCGRGEAEPTAYYGESAESALAALAGFDPSPLARIEQDAAVSDIVAGCAEQLGSGNMSVLAALDAALWDVRGKQRGMAVWAMLGAPPRCSAPTSYTIGMGDPDTMAREAERVVDAYKVLKIKVGGEQDMACLAAIRRVTELPIRVDANAAWTGDESVERIAAMSEFGLELVEQPCAREDIDGLRQVTGAVDVPVIADESCHVAADVDALAGAVTGVNIKLVKSGGLCEAKRVVERARARGLALMVGCMTSSSLAVTAAAHISGWMDFVDLDGNLLLAADPFCGSAVADGVTQIPSDPGLGVFAR